MKEYVPFANTNPLQLLILLSACSEIFSFHNINKTDEEHETSLDTCHESELFPDDSDKWLKAPEIIKKYGYPVEIHHVTSEDGYILEFHRIPWSPHAPPRGREPPKPVLVQHGIMASSVNWVLPPLDSALGYILADLGYDVWLGNCRGSSYSLGHTNPRMQHTNTKYWDFSWHEMGVYDVPAMIDYILDFTNHTQLTYIGHSMGATMFFVAMSLRPEYNEKVEMMYALAPVAFCGHATSFFKLLAPFSYNLEKLYQILGRGQLIPERLRTFLNPLMADICHHTEQINCGICNNLYFALFNSNGKQLNYTMLPIYFSHFPDRVSTKTVSHYGQLLVSGKFQQFDNRLVVPSLFPHKHPLISVGKRPEEYDFKKITVPIVLFWAERDNLADPKDVAMLIKRLPNVHMAIKVCYPLFNHNDFLFGVHVSELVYEKLIKILHYKNYKVDVECEETYVDQKKKV
ncbi:unnamed protein product [Orchesella dallaii]|uniref:AB hydrolase-1 domain-containing protein n=1 Tax=Orchesella dallaii TaxID=48710 RepID=A0ABP1PWL8_9HEXA